MTLTKNPAPAIGVLILLAYGVLVSEFTQIPPVVALADIISGLAVIGIATLFYPYFKLIHTHLSFSYLALKTIEGFLMIIAGLAYLFPTYQPLRDQVYSSIHVLVFIISGFIFYLLLLKSRFVPRFISIWGLVAILALLASTTLKMFAIQYTILDALLILIITNEVFLAFWLIAKTRLPLPQTKSSN